MKKKIIWSDLDYRKDVTVTMKLINYDLLLLDAIWLTTGVSRGLKLKINKLHATKKFILSNLMEI